MESSNSVLVRNDVQLLLDSYHVTTLRIAVIVSGNIQYFNSEAPIPILNSFEFPTGGILYVIYTTTTSVEAMYGSDQRWR